MRLIEPDVTAKIRFYSAEEGGRKTPTRTDYLGCIFEYRGKNFECRLLLNDVGSILPGEETTIPIKFLNPDLIIPRLRVGDKFTLRELTGIAEGEIKVVHS